MYAIEKEIYEYFSTLINFDDDGNSEGDDIIGLAPSNPNSNISNNALGYFSAHTYRKYNLIIRWVRFKILYSSTGLKPGKSFKEHLEMDKELSS